MKTWNEARKILCVRLDLMGDLIMTTPAIRALKNTFSNAKLYLTTSSSGASIASLIPEIEATLIYDAPWMKATEKRNNSREDQQFIDKLKQYRFDGAVIFTAYRQSPLPAAQMFYMADISLRLAHCFENPYQLLSHWIPETEPELWRHEVKRQLDLVASIGAKIDDERLWLHIPASCYEKVLHLLEGLRINFAKPIILIHPGASASSRRYPPEGFARAVSMILEARKENQIIFTGSAEEIGLIRSIQKQILENTYTLAGHLTPSELSALISVSDLLICNNTGPAHIAAAMNTPVVDLYALTNPQHTPWKVPHRVLSFDVPCKYCFKSVCPQQHHRCLRLIKPAQIVASAFELLKSYPKLKQKTESSMLGTLCTHSA